MPFDVEAQLRRPKIDVHHHVRPGEAGLKASDHLVEVAKKLGIVELWCSAPISGRMASMDEIRQRNDGVLAAMQRHPDIIRGMCFVIPGYYKEAVAEVERCLDAGMIGIKLYNQYKICDPAVWPVIEVANERRVPVLEHAGHIEAPEHLSQQPLISDGADHAVVSQRFPEAILINAHIGGGGDWEWTLRALRASSPNVYVDISGSNLDEGQVEMAVAELGVERVLFATDGSMDGCVGKVAGARLTEEDKELICWGNAARILAAQGKQPLHAGLSSQVKGGAAS